MEQIQLLLANRVLWTGIAAWLIAQVIKTVIYAVINKEIRLERLFGDGGMPSAHSATVTAMAASTAVIYGLDSFNFAIAAMFAIIVMHDARGVRMETGKQSKILNLIMDMSKNDGQWPIWTEERLKEFVGHTPLQVAAGFVLGLVVGIAMAFIW